MKYLNIILIFRYKLIRIHNISNIFKINLLRMVAFIRFTYGRVELIIAINLIYDIKSLAILQVELALTSRLFITVIRYNYEPYKYLLYLYFTYLELWPTYIISLTI